MIRHRLRFFVFLACLLLPWLGRAEELRPDEHYDVIDPPVTMTGSKPQIVEAFNFTCPHCYHFSPTFITWAHANRDRFDIVVLPLHWKNQKDTAARAYQAAAHLGRADDMKEAIFAAHFKDKQDIDNPDVLVALAGKLGLDGKVFRETMDSFGISAKLAQNRRLVTAFGVDSTPNLVVNGRYRIHPGHASNDFNRMLSIAEQLATKK